MGQVHQIVFRFRGIMNWSKIYKTSIQFFRDRRFEFAETRYKDKTNEFEGDWRAELKVDAYTKVTYEIYFHAVDMIPTTITDHGQKIPAFNGKLEIIIKGSVDYHYDEKSPAGELKIFHGDEKKSWLHKMYFRITARDRDEDMEDFITSMADQYHEVIKGLCGVEARR